MGPYGPLWLCMIPYSPVLDCIQFLGLGTLFSFDPVLNGRSNYNISKAAILNVSKDPYYKEFISTIIFFWKRLLARACGVSVVVVRAQRFGRQSAGNDVVATKNAFLFFSFVFFFSVVYFSHRRSAWIEKLIQRKLKGAPQNLGVDPFPDPVGHFGAPWRPFWIFEVLIEGMVE